VTYRPPIKGLYPTATQVNAPLTDAVCVEAAVADSDAVADPENVPVAVAVRESDSALNPTN
jgi:hypothetical protein